MNVSSGTLVWCALAPLALGAVLQLLVARLLSSRAKGVLALLTSLPSAAAVGAAYLRVKQSGPIDMIAAPWDGPLALVFHVDALSLMFAAMGTVLGSIVLFYSIGYMAQERAATRFYAFMLTFICAMVGLVYSANLFSVYLCWEAMGLCSFSLVGFWYERKESVAGARKVLLMTHLAGYGLLAAILLIYARTGSALWTDPGMAHAFSSGVYVLMLVALLAKSVQFPLHTWIPEAMNAPTPVSALLHAACYVKAGVYLAARMHSFNQWPASWGAAMMWLGTVTMVVGVVYAMVQHDLKRMLAFHTVSQIGYIITGLGLGTPLGIAAGLLHCLNHSLFKGGLFLAAGSVQHATGTRDMNRLGGLARLMPRTATVWLISVGSMMGVPFMSGFASKWLLYTATLQAGQMVPCLLAWVVSVGTVFSCVKATSSVFLGPVTDDSSKAHEAPASMVIALGIFAAGSLVLGLAPQLAVNYVINPILPLFGLATVQVSWFGLTPAAGSWWNSGGLLIAVTSAVAGGLMYLFAGISRARGFAMQSQTSLAGATAGGDVEVFTGGESIPGPSRLPASEFSAILKSYWEPLFRITDVDKLYACLWAGLAGLSRALRSLAAWAEKRIVIVTVALFALLYYGLSSATSAASFNLFAEPESIAGPQALACLVAGAALLLAAASMKKTRALLPALAIGMAAALAGLHAAQPIARTALLEAAGLVLLIELWRRAGRRATGVFATVLVLSAASLVSGEMALASGHFATARPLLLAGFALKLGFAPLLFWLPVVAEAAPALLAGALIAVVDIAAFLEFSTLVQAHPEFLAPQGLWIALALATSLLASLWMLSERNLKRLLALSTLEDMGFLLLGLVAASKVGISGAAAGATAHALAKAQLFTSLAAPEADGALSGDAQGLAARYPYSAAGFFAGFLAMVGVPPLLGFAGRWRLYFAAASLHPWLLAGFLVSSIFALIAYALCLTRAWWGEPQAGAKAASKEPFILRFVLVALMALLLAGGLWPEALQAVAGRF